MNQTLSDSQTPVSAPSSPRTKALGVAYWVLSALTMLTCVCSAAGNGLVVWLLSRRVRRTPCAVYVLHLALADLLFLLCMASLLSLEAGRDQHPVAYEVLRRVKYFAYTAGLSLLTAISTLRCVSVVCPVWHRQHQSPRLSSWVCAGLWALSLVMNVLAAVFCSRYWSLDEKQCFAVDAVLSVLILGVFTPVMTVSSATLFLQVRRTSRQWRRRRPTRLYVVILASVLVFLVCALPLGLYWFLLYWLHLRPQVVLLYSCLSRLSSSVSCGANPVIYFLVGSRHAGPREPLEAVLQRALQEAPELEGRETPSGYTKEEGA